MSLPSTWRQFQLFDFLPIRDPKFKSEDPLFSDPTLSDITSTKSYIAFASQNAYIKILSKDNLSLLKVFCAYDLDYRISYMRPLMHSNILVTLAEKQGSPALIKVLDLTKIMQLDDSVIESDDAMKHKYVTQVAVHDGDNSYPISCFAFNEFLTCIGVGYTNGRVILVRGDMLKDRGSKQRVVYESTDPITGIQFNRMEEFLFLTTTSKILTLLTTGRNQGKPLRVLSNSQGADLDCSDLEFKSSRLIVANREGFSFYNNVSKAQVINFDVAKRRILRVFKDYLLVICPFEDTGSSGKTSLTRLLMLDLHNMHVSFSLTIPNSTLSHVFASPSDNTIYLLSTDGILYKLHEKPINQQVEIILQRDLFTIALNLANQHHLDSETLLRINRLHGDYLYEKSDFDGAIAKFIDCLPLFGVKDEKLTSSENLDDFVINVITYFKDVSNISNMTKFLAKLHELNFADADHVTLLLCCYCKLKLSTDLDKFVDDLDLEKDVSSATPVRLDLSQLNFTLIINLLKECGFYSQVVKLLIKLNRPLLIVDIQLNELHQYQQCLDFIKSLPVDELLRVLIDYSKHLLDCMPLETTELLINVFTGKYKPDESFSLLSKDQVQEEAPEEHITDEKTEHIAVSSYSAFVSYLSGRTTQEEEKEEPKQEPQEPTYLPPRPSLVFPGFLNHPAEFVVFLEACIEAFDRYQGNINNKKVLLMTLFEMYLSRAADQPEGKQDWLAKARTLLEENVGLLDSSNVLLISHLYNFKDGERIVTEKSDNFDEGLFRAAQIAGDLQEALSITKRRGDQRPLLYKLLLKFLVSSEAIYNQATTKDFRFVLEKVKEHRVCSPLEVIKILSSNDFATIGVVKDYLIDFVGQTKKDITNNERLIQSYESEASKNADKLTELTTAPMVMQNNKCSNCELRLEYPMIHFRCKHSYHQKCLNENTYIPGADSFSHSQPRCPLCINELKLSEQLRDTQLRAKEDYATFEMNLNESDDRFKVMSEYLGKGVMEGV